MKYTGIIMNSDYPRYYLYLLYSIFCIGLFVALSFILPIQTFGSYWELAAIAAGILTVLLVLCVSAIIGMSKRKRWGRIVSMVLNGIVVLMCFGWYLLSAQGMGNDKPTLVEVGIGVLVISLVWVESTYWNLKK